MKIHKVVKVLLYKAKIDTNDRHMVSTNKLTMRTDSDELKKNFKYAQLSHGFLVRSKLIPAYSSSCLLEKKMIIDLQPDIRVMGLHEKETAGISLM